MIWSKEPQKGHFWWSGAFLQQNLWAPNSWKIVILSLAIPEVTGMRLFEEIVKTGAIFVLRGQKWPKTAKMAIFVEATLITLMLSCPRFQDIIPSSLVSTHVIQMRLFDIFVKMGADFGPLGLIYGHFGAKNGPKVDQKWPKMVHFVHFFPWYL